MNKGEYRNRLARACSRGTTQASLVNELLAGTVTIRDTAIAPDRSWIYVGKSGLCWKSFKNLRARLVGVGFVLEVDRVRQTVTMHFPEELED